MSNQTLPFILASSSPQRSKLLKQMGIKARIVPVNIHEDQHARQDTHELVEFLAREKLFMRLCTPHPDVSPRSVVLAADTMVSMNGKSLGKPKNKADAECFLKQLSGETHEVYTAISVYIPLSSIVDMSRIQTHPTLTVQEQSIGLPHSFGKGIVVAAFSSASVTLKTLSDAEIKDYLDWNEYLGAAGGYRVQGRAGCFLSNLQGSYTGVMGLPINVLYDILMMTSFWT